MSITLRLKSNWKYLAGNLGYYGVFGMKKKNQLLIRLKGSQNLILKDIILLLKFI